MSILFSLYCIVGVFVAMVVVVNLILDNKFTKFHKRCMYLFPIHSLIIIFICWISYSVATHKEMKDKQCPCDGCKMSRAPNQGYQPCHKKCNGGE
ncbi:hypothetical protein VPIG_00139 [Vibrio phage PWH3a-P1]|uniref:hypothetical protein n=1 Tax=Vibrio phage PWH3a-P1 TaxID=754058 RepID=UPI0002C0A269|nr:hypothetical protein VPIG_00139 [Vibrio phage PWH3a-P1]AGH31996.1 hypothetical protein VPIG_00139 [Vibrio phage PWH3a-P1]